MVKLIPTSAHFMPNYFRFSASNNGSKDLMMPALAKERSLKMKTEIIVEYFLRKNGLEKKCFDDALKAVALNKNINQGLFKLYICFVICVISAASISFIGLVICSFFAIAITINFMTICTNQREIFKLCNQDNGETIKKVVITVATFTKLFGDRPENLDAIRVSKKLTAKAKQVLKLRAKGNREKENAELELFGRMFDAAKMLMPINGPTEIFEAAFAGGERPPWPSLLPSPS